MYKVFEGTENSHLLGHHWPQHLVSILDRSVRRWCPLTEWLVIYRTLYYIDTDEIPGFFLLLKNHIFIARSEDTFFVFHV